MGSKDYNLVENLQRILTTSAELQYSTVHQRIITPEEIRYSFVLLGERKGKDLWGILDPQMVGNEDMVCLDHARILAREENRRDVLGFFFTKPKGTSTLSDQEFKTMESWVFSLGKPLLCLIQGIDGISGVAMHEVTDKVITIPLYKVKLQNNPTNPRQVMFLVREDWRTDLQRYLDKL